MNHFIKRVIRKINRTVHGVSPVQEELENLKKRGLRIGDHVEISTDYPFDSLYPGLITVGDYVGISTNVKILAHDASMGYAMGGTCKIGIVDIGNHVFIGANTTILCNVRIGDNAIIGAGSVVTCDVPAGTVYAGNPARFVKYVNDFAQQHQRNLETHPVLQKPWREITQMDADGFALLREELQDTCGYIVRKK